jgi:spermidine/putrescine transport system permease protein
MAYFLAFRVTRHKMLWLIVITIPFWTSYLLRVFAWKIVLGFNGVINSSLIWLGLIEKPLEFLLYNPVAVVITLAHAWVVYAILPIYAAFERLPSSLLEASGDLGARGWMTFRRVVVPVISPGLVAASIFTFSLTLGDYITPITVGKAFFIGNAIYNLVGLASNLPLAAAFAMVPVAVMAIYLTLAGSAARGAVGPWIQSRALPHQGRTPHAVLLYARS